MPGLAPDHNMEGHFRILMRRFQSPTWRGVWDYLKFTVESFETLGLSHDSSDGGVWRRCQDRQIVLVTGNRNQRGADSLEATIRREVTPGSLPVITIANLDRLLESKEYVERVVEELLRILIDIDNYRGTGRLYVP